MPAILADFIASHPNLKVSLHDGPADYVHHLVRANEVDLAVSSLSQADDDLDFTPLMHDDIGVVCRDDHALAGRESLNWKELQGSPSFVTARRDCSRIQRRNPCLGRARFYFQHDFTPPPCWRPVSESPPCHAWLFHRNINACASFRSLTPCGAPDRFAQARGPESFSGSAGHGIVYPKGVRTNLVRWH